MVRLLSSLKLSRIGDVMCVRSRFVRSMGGNRSMRCIGSTRHSFVAVRHYSLGQDEIGTHDRHTISQMLRKVTATSDAPVDTSVSFPTHTISKPTESNNNLSVNIRLLSLIDTNDPYTIEFLLDNMDMQLDHDLLEKVISKTLSKSTFDKMVMLSELCIYKQKLVLSNQLWNRFISYTCETFSPLGAKFVLHNVIDRHQFYDDNYSAYNSTQDFFPFLVTPKVLESLCGIFSKANMPDEIILVRDYLKRFYSLYGERVVFKSINIYLVETYSKMGDTKQALKTFKYLCMIFQGHRNLMQREEFLKQVHSTFHGAYHWRLKNIATNQYKYPQWPEDTKTDFDKLQQLDMEENDVCLYWPIDAKSATTRVQPFMEGSLEITDLPFFSHLINEMVSAQMKEKGSKSIPYLIKIVRGNHFRLITFILNGLTSHNYFGEAELFLGKVKGKHLDVRLPILFPDDMFLQVFKNCSRRLNQLTAAGLNNVDALLELETFVKETMKKYVNVKRKQKKNMNSKVLTVYLSLVLNCPQFDKKLVTSHLDLFMRRRTNDRIYLMKEDFDAFGRMFDLEHSVFKDVIVTR